MSPYYFFYFLFVLRYKFYEKVSSRISAYYVYQPPFTNFLFISCFLARRTGKYLHLHNHGYLIHLWYVYGLELKEDDYSVDENFFFPSRPSHSMENASIKVTITTMEFHFQPLSVTSNHVVSLLYMYLYISRFLELSFTRGFGLRLYIQSAKYIGTNTSCLEVEREIRKCETCTMHISAKLAYKLGANHRTWPFLLIWAMKSHNSLNLKITIPYCRFWQSCS